DDDLRDCGDAARPNRSWAAPDALRAGLRNLGYVDGGNLVIEPRYAGGQVERLSTLAAELVRLKVDLLVTAAAGSARAARKATSTAPQLKTADDAASALGLTVLPVAVKGPRSGDLDRAFATIEKEHLRSLLVIGDSTLGVQRDRIAELSIKHRLPT